MPRIYTTNMACFGNACKPSTEVWLDFLLFFCIQFHHKAICNVSVDLIHLLSEYYKELTEYENDLPLKIVEVSSLPF